MRMQSFQHTEHSATKRTITFALALMPTVAFIVTSAMPNDARAADLDCPSASEEGQRLRDKGRYVAAREMFRSCARTSCPTVVSRDCTKWLSEIEDGMPSIVVAARDTNSGGDLASVRVLVDGEPVTTRLDGKPVFLDPGDHALRFEAEGYSPATQQVIVRVGERNRLVRVELRPLAATVTTPPSQGQGQGDQPPIDTTSPKPATSSAPPILAYVLGGVGIVALGGGVFLGLSSKKDLSDLRQTCAPFCDQSQLDAVKTRMVIADVALGVGIVAVGVAAFLFITHSSKSAEPPKSAAR